MHFPVCYRRTLRSRLLKNAMSAGQTRQNATKKRSICFIFEHFEELFNAVWPSAIVFNALLDGDFRMPLPKPCGFLESVC